MDPLEDRDFFLQPCPAIIVASSNGILREVMLSDGCLDDQNPRIGSELDTCGLCESGTRVGGQG